MFSFILGKTDGAITADNSDIIIHITAHDYEAAVQKLCNLLYCTMTYLFYRDLPALLDDEYGRPQQTEWRAINYVH